MNWLKRISRWLSGSTKSVGSLGIGLRAALGGSAPGGWASDHREETAHYTGFNYIAIHAIASQVAGATVTVFGDGEQQSRRQSRRKSLGRRVGSFSRWKSLYGADDRETDPLPTTHPLVKLLKSPNPFESGASFRYRQAQQVRLTGTCFVWNVPSVSGPTCERYVIPTAMVSPVPPTSELPIGGWRINPVASRYTPVVDDGYVDCPSWQRILGQVIDARQIQIIRLPHAWYFDDGQSPLSAGAKWVDSGEAVDEARYHQLKNGIDPSIVWNLPPDVSPDQNEIDRTQAKISAKYGGPENVGRVLVAQSGTTITPLSTSPKEMCYSEGFQDLKSAVLALHQTPPVAVGLQEPGAYAAYNASMKAWRHAAIQPLCDLLAESDTEHLAPQFGSGLTIEIESDTVDDTDLIERQLQNDLAAKVRTKNEWRAVRGMPPLPGSLGDELVGTESSPTNDPPDTPSTESADSIVSAKSRRVSADRSGNLQPRLNLEQGSLRSDNRSNDEQNLSVNHFDGEDAQRNVIDSDLGSSESNEISGDADEAARTHLIAEILYGFFHRSKLPIDDAPWVNKAKPFDPSKHPRDELGKFAVSATAKEIKIVRENVSKLLKGEFSHKIYKNVLEKLSALPTSDLEKLHREHGFSPSPQVRSHLLRSVRARLSVLPRADAGAFRRSTVSQGVDVYVQHPEKLHQILHSRAGIENKTPLSPEHWGKLVGAQPGARVYVYPSRNSSEVEIFVDHPDYRARRLLTGGGVIKNVELKVARRKQGSGIATQILKEQVESAIQHGFRSIEAGAAGKGTHVRSNEATFSTRGSSFGGYYAWPRLGFDGRIDSLMKERANSKSRELRAIAADFGKKFPGVKKVSQLMKTKDGRNWWRNYGGYFEGTFNLAKGSSSRRILTAYLAEKGMKLKLKSLPSVPILDENQYWDHRFNQTAVEQDQRFEASHDPFDRSDFDDDHDGGENADPLTPEDEEILDRIWDQIAQEEANDQSPDDDEFEEVS